MNKILLISTITLALVQSAFANNSLSKVFLNADINGEIRVFYFDKDVHKGPHDDILATGILLKYQTLDYYGFKLGAMIQAAANPWANSDAKDIFRGDMANEGARLSEAYIDYSLYNTNIRAGRTFINTPLIAGSGSRLIYESFEGVHLSNKDIKDTTLGFVYVNKFQGRTNNKGDIGNFHRTGLFTSFNGMYSAYIKNSSIDGLTLIGAYARVNDIMKESNLDNYYVEAIYKNSINSLNYSLHGQSWYNTYSSQKVDTIYGYALKLALNYSNLSGYFAFSQISNDKVEFGRLSHGLGNDSDTIYTNSLITAYNYDPNMDAYAINLDYKLSNTLAIGTLFSYTNTHYTNDDGVKEVFYTGVYANMDFNSILKGLSSVIQFESIGMDKKGHELRTKLIYKF